MDDLISRKAALNAVEELDIPEDMCVFEILSHIEVALGALPSVQPKIGKWIPCSERLPTDTGTVLITHRGGVSFGWYNGNYWERGASTNHRPLQTVKAWMPLPQPYKEKDDG